MNAHSLGIFLIILAFFLQIISVIIGYTELANFSRISFLTGSGLGFAVLASGARLRRYEGQWFAILVAWTIAVFLSIPHAYNPGEALLDWIRQLFISIYAIGVTLLFRNSLVRRYFLLGMLLIALFLSVTILVYWYAWAGPTVPKSFAEIRAFKLYLFLKFKIHTNPLAFTVVVTSLLGALALRKLRQRVLLWLVTTFAVVLTGSRAVLLSLLLAFPLAHLVNYWLSAKRVYRFLLLYSSLLVFLVGFVYLLADSGELASPSLLGPQFLRKLDDITSGRLELWTAALRKFSVSPIFGWGAGSWHEELEMYLPDFGNKTQDLLQLSSGAFHNAYVTALAERGVLGFISGLLIIIYIAIQIFSFREGNVSNPRVRDLYMLGLIWLFFILIRGFVEVGGIWGYANAVGDFIVFASGAFFVAAFGELRENSLPKRRRSSET